MITDMPRAVRRPLVETCPYMQRAVLIWPRLDRRMLAKCGCDARRIARFVSHRTSLPVEQITAMLENSDQADSELTYYFG